MIASCAVAVNFRLGNQESIFAKLASFERGTFEAAGFACSADRIVEEESVFANAALLSVSDSTLDAVFFGDADFTHLVDKCPIGRTYKTRLVAVACDVEIAEANLRKHVPSKTLKANIMVVFIAEETTNTANGLARAVS